MSASRGHNPVKKLVVISTAGKSREQIVTEFARLLRQAGMLKEAPPKPHDPEEQLPLPFPLTKPR
jgi:hypothetical protein